MTEADRATLAEARAFVREMAPATRITGAPDSAAWALWNACLHIKALAEIAEREVSAG